MKVEKVDWWVQTFPNTILTGQFDCSNIWKKRNFVAQNKFLFLIHNIFLSLRIFRTDPPSNCTGFDVIVASDVLYEEELIEPLMNTILICAAPQCTFYSAFRRRSLLYERKFLSLLKDNKFEIEEVTIYWDLLTSVIDQIPLDFMEYSPNIAHIKVIKCLKAQ